MKRFLALLLTMVMVFTLGFVVLTQNNFDYTQSQTHQTEQVEDFNIGNTNSPFPPPDES